MTTIVPDFKSPEKFEELKNLVDSYVNGVTKEGYDSVDEDLPHYVFETAVQMIYGDDIFDKLRLDIDKVVPVEHPNVRVKPNGETASDVAVIYNPYGRIFTFNDNGEVREYAGPKAPVILFKDPDYDISILRQTAALDGGTPLELRKYVHKDLSGYALLCK